MAKETVKVDNKLEEIKLEKTDKMNKKKKEKKNPKKTKNNNSEVKQSYIAKVNKEMKLVTWPTRKQVTKYSFASIIMIILLAALFFGVATLFDVVYSLIQGWIGIG